MTVDTEELSYLRCDFVLVARSDEEDWIDFETLR